MFLICPLFRPLFQPPFSRQIIQTGVDIKHTILYGLFMKYHAWNNEKNEKLKKERGISFEEIVFYVEHGQLVAIIDHPNKEKYANQKKYVVNVNDYVYLVPFVESEKEIFLKTIIPSRKATKKFLEET